MWDNVCLLTNPEAFTTKVRKTYGLVKISCYVAMTASLT